MCGGPVVVEVHANHDAEEAADLGHLPIYYHALSNCPATRRHRTAWRLRALRFAPDPSAIHIRSCVGSLPTSQPQCASPRRSAQGPSEVKSETLRERGGRGSSWPTRPTVWPEGPRAIDPTCQPPNGSRNTPRPLRRIETSEVATFRERVPSSFADRPPTPPRPRATADIPPPA